MLNWGVFDVFAFHALSRALRGVQIRLRGLCGAGAAARAELAGEQQTEHRQHTGIAKTTDPLQRHHANRRADHADYADYAD